MDGDDVGMQLDRELLLLLKAHRRLVHSSLEKYGLYPGQPEVMFAIAKNEGARQNELAQSSSIRPATVTVMLGRLENSGMITRRTDEQDKRALRVFLTPKGKAVCKKIKEARQGGSARLYAALSAQEQRELMRLLKKIRADIDEQMRAAGKTEKETCADD